MTYSRDRITAAAEAGIIDKPALDRLLTFLDGQPNKPVEPTSRFDLSHLLWYAGALIVMGAMGLFSTVAFAKMGGGALTATAIVYALAFLAVGRHLWRDRDLQVPGGLLIACAVAMAPLAVYGIQEATGAWSATGKPGTLRDYYIWIKGGWVPMELATIASAVLALRFFPFPFILAVAALATWFLTMDIAEFVIANFGSEDIYTWSLRTKVTMWFGLAVMIVAWIVDLKHRSADFAFWLHLAGIAAFWGGMTGQSSDSEVAKLIYCLINICLVLLAIFLIRRAYAVFGALGVTIYLGHLATNIFRNSLIFPFALSAIGISVIGLGILYFRNRAAIQTWLEQNLPAFLKALRPAHAR